MGSSQWSGAFLGALQSQGLGAGGFEVDGGSVDQFNPLPWTNLNQVIVRFSQPVSAGPGSLTVQGTNGGTIPVQSFSYDVSTNTGTWTLNRAIGTDRVLIDLSAIPESFSLGGLDSGPEQFRLNVLAGDVNRNARTTIADAVDVRNRVGTSVGNANYSVFHDLNGSGTIDATDRTIALLNVFATLPASQVSPSPAAPAAVVASAPGATETPPPLPPGQSRRDSEVSILKAPRRMANQATIDSVFESSLPARAASADSASRLRASRGNRASTVSAAVDSIFAG
jgi:hypothetical protein